MRKKTILYLRYSTDMQRPASCDDQEREIRKGLDRLGVPHLGAVVVRDEAQSGTSSKRDQFTELLEMIRRGEVGVLAVDDQSRFSRAEHASLLVNDIVFNGGRFISTGEGIDTNQDGWELRVKVMELHHSTTIRELGRRIRRGQAGRVLDGNGSAGDFPFGYRSRYVDDDWAEQLQRRGPKPKKVIEIDEQQAAVVRQVFEWFVGGISISAIARRLTANKVPKCHRSSGTTWHHWAVRRMLANRKYRGEWSWGRTRTRRDSQGRKRQVATDDTVTQQRPELRIIDDDIWRKAQARLAKLHESYGQKDGQASRRAKVHHTEIYPASLLGGLIFCGQCGTRMTVQCSGKYKYLGCPKRRCGSCDMITRVRIDTAEEAVLAEVTKFLLECEGWVDAVIQSMRHHLAATAGRGDETLTADKRRLVEAKGQLQNLVDALARTGRQSATVLDRITTLEEEVAKIRERVLKREASPKTPTLIPRREEVLKELEDLPRILRSGAREAALLLRRLIDRITAEPVPIPGKKRGYVRLQFRLDPLPAVARTAEPAAAPSQLGRDVTIEIGGPTRADELAPRIVEMREQSVSWSVISRELQVPEGTAWAAWKRLTGAA